MHERAMASKNQIKLKIGRTLVCFFLCFYKNSNANVNIVVDAVLIKVAVVVLMETSLFPTT